mmetsp:Transcript_26553/g.53134  ORF Transcript_26553/g.53134 Transcript_26553/m.53134 type:complete len:385 (-) Transcript_26553:165-1319(-)
MNNPSPIGTNKILLLAIILIAAMGLLLDSKSLHASYLVDGDAVMMARAHKHNNICPSARKLFDNHTALMEAIDKQTRFHLMGGSLTSIEKYLSENMEDTLDRLGAQFVPEGEGDPVEKPIQYLQHYYQTQNVPHGGYRQRLPGKFTGGNNGKVFFRNRWFDVIEPNTPERFTASLGHVGPTCSNVLTFAAGKHEEKHFCVDSKTNDGSTCKIFSIGSNDEWGFEREVVRKLPNCIVHTFDCTLVDNKPLSKPKSDKVKFHPYCISSGNSQPPFLTYEQLVLETGSSVPPKLLKMDVEGFEFDTILNSVLASPGDVYPEQIMMEVHWTTHMVDIPWMFRNREAAEMALFFGVIFNYGGYIPVLVQLFPDSCPYCMEVLFVRVLCD